MISIAKPMKGSNK